MKLLIPFLLAVVTACGPCGRGDVAWAGLSAIFFNISKDGAEVFNNEDARKSLQVSSLERQQSVDFEFTGSDLRIMDDEYNGTAHDQLICPSYILKYRTDDIDTLKVCYKIMKNKCGGTEFEDVKVFWDQVQVEYSYARAIIK